MVWGIRQCAQSERAIPGPVPPSSNSQESRVTCRFQTCRANQEMGPSLGNIVLGGHEVEGDEEGEIDKSGASSSDEFEAEPQDREHKGDSSRKLKSKVKWALDSHNDPDDGSRGPIA